MDDEPEAIRQQMTETRAALSDKLETLEHQVVETVQGATSAVQETVENVKEAVHDTVETVKGSVRETVESVKEAFDLSTQVDRHPWLMVGGAVAVGYLGGRLLSATGAEASAEDSAPELGLAHRGEPEPPAGDYGRRAYYRPGPTSEGWTRSLADALGPELNDLKGLAIGSLFGIVRDLVKQAVPTNLASSLNEVVDRITVKLGGSPVAGSLLEPQKELSGGQDEWRRPEKPSQMTSSLAEARA